MNALEAERVDISYRTGIKLSLEELQKKLEAERVSQPKKGNK